MGRLYFFLENDTLDSTKFQCTRTNKINNSDDVIRPQQFNPSTDRYFLLKYLFGIILVLKNFINN